MITLLKIIAVIAAFRLLTTPLRRRKEKKRWEQWNKIQDHLEHDYCNQLLFGQISSIRQKARTGTKAYVKWYRGDAPQAIWISGIWLNHGDFILVEGSEGHGLHHSENVLYIKSLIQRLPHDAEYCWNKYNKRLEKKQQQEEKNCLPAEKAFQAEKEPITTATKVEIINQPETSEPALVE